MTIMLILTLVNMLYWLTFLTALSYLKVLSAPLKYVPQVDSFLKLQIYCIYCTIRKEKMILMLMTRTFMITEFSCCIVVCNHANDLNCIVPHNVVTSCFGLCVFIFSVCNIMNSVQVNY